jgi:probable phosphoglycerate mutase
VTRELLLVRHAETAWTGVRYCGASDPPLSEVGRLTADRLAAALVHVVPPGTPIVSGPSLRTTDTATRIARRTGGAITIDERWREVDFGEAEGLTFDEVAARWPALAADVAAGRTAIDWPGGEPAAGFAGRVTAAIAGLAPRPLTVVVSHAGPIRLATGIGLEPGAHVRLAVDEARPGQA